MKKILKIAGIIVLSLFVLFYIVFVFVLPNVVNLNKYMPQLKQIVAEQTSLIIDVDNPKIITTPLLAIGMQADKISVKLPDNTEFVKTDKIVGRISFPHLLFFTLKVTKLDVENPQINVDIVNGKEYKIAKIMEEIAINSGNKDQDKNLKEADFNLSNIKIMIPKVKISNYSVVVNDLKTKDYLRLCGNEFIIGYKNGQSAYFKTIADLFVNNNKNITADIDIDTFIPKITVTESEVKEETQNYDFINPVAVYKAYDLKTNITSKIKIRQKENKINANGYFNIDNLTLNLGGVQLPESKLHISSKGTTSDIDSELYVTKNEKIELDGLFNYSKNPELQMKIKTDNIYLDNILNLLRAALASANIKNNLDTIKGEGYFNADTQFKTNFKKIESKGNITIYNCIIRNKKDNKRLSRVNSVISLDNSILKFIDTYIEILDAVFKIDGTIDETSKTDISIVMERMPVKKLFNLFMPAEISKSYDINSGNIDLTAKINGELQNAAADIKLSVKNFALTDKINNINYINDLFTADFNSDFKTYNGIINNSNFIFIMNGVSAVCDKFSIAIDDKDIVIEPSKLKINKSTDINLSGKVNNYALKPEFEINADGNLTTEDIKKLLGSEIGLYIKEKGSIPIKISISGDSKGQNIKASLDADKDNYITFADVESLLNKKTALQTIIEIKNDSVKIKDTGLYIKDGNNQEEVVGIDGTITKLNTSNPSINLIKLKMPKELTASLAIFPNSKLTIKGSAFISGELNQPKVKGDLNISNMNIPELYMTMKNAMAKFEGKDLDIDISNLVANDSIFDILLNADLSSSKNFVVKSLNIKSSYVDADKIVKISESMEKYTSPVASSNISNVKTGSSNNNIPLIVKDGSIDMQQIKSGSILLNDTTAKILLSDNVLYLNNLVTSGFNGRIFGNISMNILTSEIKADVKGTGLDVEKTLADTAAVKDTLSGTMDFNADISLKGATYEEQVKTLNGKVDFTMKDGSLGPIGRLENLVSADNIKSIALLNTVVGCALKSTVDTSKYNILKGNLIFNNGIAQINPITSVGDYMSAYIFGSFDVLRNTADMKLRGRLAPTVTDSLGQLTLLNPVNIIKNSSSMNLLLGQSLLKMCEQVTEDELAQIPAVAKESINENTAKFQVIIRGDVAQPAKIVRSFKWIALDSEISEAQEKLNIQGTVSIPTSVDDVKQQAKELVKSILPVETQENSTNETSLKEQLKQTQQSLWNQLKEQAKQSITESNLEE